MGFPQEIWDDITGYLSAKSAYNTSAILRFPVSESNEKSAAVWEAIFRDGGEDGIWAAKCGDGVWVYIRMG